MPAGWQHPQGPLWPSTPEQPLHWGAAQVCANANDSRGSRQLGKGETPALWDGAKQRNMCPGQDHGAKWMSQELVVPQRGLVCQKEPRAPARLPQPQALALMKLPGPRSLSLFFSQVGAPHPTRMRLKEQDTSFVPGNK